MKRSLVLLLCFAVTASGCSSTTLIRTTDPEAKIYVDGEFAGKGSVTHSDQKIVGSHTSVRIEKPGCAPTYHGFSRNEEFSVGACIGGALGMVPYLWIMGYKPEHNYEYTCQKL